MIRNVNQLSPGRANGDSVSASYKFKTRLTPNTFCLLQTAQHNHIVFKGVQTCLQKWFASPVLVTGPNPLLTTTVGKLKFSRYRPGVTQRVGRGIALLFHDHGTRRWWMVSSALYPRKRPGTHFTGGWVGSRAGLDGRKISSTPGFDPGPSSPWLVAIPAHNDSGNVVQFTKHTISLLCCW